MKLTAYKVNGQTILYIPSKILDEFNSGLLKIKGLSFVAHISEEKILRSDGSFRIEGRITIPKRMAEHLKLKHKEQVEVQNEP